jgi:hypothetical protein
MAKTQTHNEILVRPPPGTRFTVFGSDMLLQFERGREQEIYDWLQSWLKAYVEPEIRAAAPKSVIIDGIEVLPVPASPTGLPSERPSALPKSAEEGGSESGWWCHARINNGDGTMAQCEQFNASQREWCRKCGAVKESQPTGVVP